MSEERFDRIDRELAGLKNQMLTLHEQLRDDIRAMRVVEPELERRWKADDANVREDIGRRLDPLESIVRKHFGT